MVSTRSVPTEPLLPVPLDQLSRTRVLVVGDAMLDRYWFGNVHRVSPEAPVPIVKVETCDERPGGAANVALNLAALGGQATLLSVVGSDESATTLARLLSSAGVKNDLVQDPAGVTTVKLRVVGQHQQLLRIDFEALPSARVLDTKFSAFERALKLTDVLVLSDYGKGALARIPEMIACAKAAGKAVLVDPKGEDYRCYAGATLLTPNCGEFRQVAGRWNNEAELEEKAQAWRHLLGLEALLITRSEAGMSLFTPNGVHHEPAQAREVYDVTGAGDTVIATLALMLAAGLSLTAAVKWANRAAGLVVGKLGTAVVHPAELFALEPSTR